MPDLTERESIRECKRMWEEIVESGLPKWQFLFTEAGEKWAEKNYTNDCPLCQYVAPYETGIDYCLCPKKCPLNIQTGEHCESLGYSTDPKGFYEYVRRLKE